MWHTVVQLLSYLILCCCWCMKIKAGRSEVQATTSSKASSRHQQFMQLHSYLHHQRTPSYRPTSRKFFATTTTSQPKGKFTEEKMAEKAAETTAKNDDAAADNRFSTSTGLTLSDGDWLDDHFGAMKVEYDDMLRYVGIQPGWTVLDAGCGTGSYLPLLMELVGTDGEIHAMDLTPENLDLVKRHFVDNTDNKVTIIPKLGNLVEHPLPYPDDTFNAIWFANISQYLSDEELQGLLPEFYRILKPGGLLAIKEWDMTSWMMSPLENPSLLQRFCTIMHLHQSHFQRVYRTINLPRMVRQSGNFDPVQFQYFPSVLTHPLSPVQMRYVKSICKFLHSFVDSEEVQEYVGKDHPNIIKVLNQIGGVESSEGHIMNDPDFCYRENHIVVIGTKQPAA